MVLELAHAEAEMAISARSQEKAKGAAAEKPRWLWTAITSPFADTKTTMLVLWT
jgi:hypothetical protein